MKNNLRILAALHRMLDLNNFYAVTVYTENINLQGRFHSNTVKRCTANKFKLIPFDNSGYVQFQRGRINITLTE
jgi:hypothetical protein